MLPKKHFLFLFFGGSLGRGLERLGSELGLGFGLGLGLGLRLVRARVRVRVKVSGYCEELRVVAKG
jgi:hypothetical protein